jgi:hypothetical protein
MNSLAIAAFKIRAAGGEQSLNVNELVLSLQADPFGKRLGIDKPFIPGKLAHFRSLQLFKILQANQGGFRTASRRQYNAFASISNPVEQLGNISFYLTNADLCIHINLSNCIILILQFYQENLLL